MVKKGSALLIVMIVIAGVVSATVGVQRIALLELSTSTKEEDNVFAEAAARSGIDDGLLRYRYEKNVSTGDNINRVDLNTGVTNITLSKTNPPAVENKNHQFYDLYITYQVSSITNMDIAKDDYIELSGFQDSATPYQLKSTFNCVSGATGIVNVQKITRIKNDGADFSQIEENVDLVGSTPKDHFMPIANVADLSTSIRIRPYSCPIKASFSLVDGGGLAFTGVKFDGMTTYIVSTGYYGDAKKSYVAEIDRKKGTLLGVYDFTLYGKGGITTN